MTAAGSTRPGNSSLWKRQSGLHGRRGNAPILPGARRDWEAQPPGAVLYPPAKTRRCPPAALTPSRRPSLRVAAPAQTPQGTRWLFQLGLYSQPSTEHVVISATAGDRDHVVEGRGEEQASQRKSITQLSACSRGRTSHRGPPARGGSGPETGDQRDAGLQSLPTNSPAHPTSLALSRPTCLPPLPSPAQHAATRLGSSGPAGLMMPASCPAPDRCPVGPSRGRTARQPGPERVLRGSGSEGSPGDPSSPSGGLLLRVPVVTATASKLSPTPLREGHLRSQHLLTRPASPLSRPPSLLLRVSRRPRKRHPSAGALAAGEGVGPSLPTTGLDCVPHTWCVDRPREGGREGEASNEGRLRSRDPRAQPAPPAHAARSCRAPGNSGPGFWPEGSPAASEARARGGPIESSWSDPRRLKAGGDRGRSFPPLPAATRSHRPRGIVSTASEAARPQHSLPARTRPPRDTEAWSQHHRQVRRGSGAKAQRGEEPTFQGNGTDSQGTKWFGTWTGTGLPGAHRPLPRACHTPCTHLRAVHGRTGKASRAPARGALAFGAGPVGPPRSKQAAAAVGCREAPRGP